MDQLPVEHARRLFDQVRPKSWSRLHQMVREHQGPVTGLQGDIVDRMLPALESLEHNNPRFPNSGEELAEIVNQHLTPTGPEASSDTGI